MVYKAGDLITYDKTGDLRFWSRADDQVKINGQRVELGAVESGVLACGGVRSCAILVTDGGGSRGKALAAFVVAEEGKELSGGMVREEVSRKVARHEVPHRIVVVDSIPLTTEIAVPRWEIIASIPSLGRPR